MDRVPREEPAPFIFGRLLHEVFEKHSKGVSMEKALDLTTTDWQRKASETTDPLEQAVRTGALSQLSDLSEPLTLWEDQYEWEVANLETEEPFEFQYTPSLVLTGRPDRVGLLDNKIWHVQNRGLNSSTNFGVYLGLARRHYHEHVYASYLSQKYKYRQYGGTIFNLVRKLKYRTNITKKNPEGVVKPLSEMFFQHPMVIDLNSDLHHHVMQSVVQWAAKMEEAQHEFFSNGTIPPPNEGANGGMWGNSPDVYYRVLVGEIILEDDRYFKDRIDPYAPVADAAE